MKGTVLITARPPSYYRTLPSPLTTRTKRYLNPDAEIEPISWQTLRRRASSLCRPLPVPHSAQPPFISSSITSFGYPFVSAPGIVIQPMFRLLLVSSDKASRPRCRRGSDMHSKCLLARVGQDARHNLYGRRWPPLDAYEPRTLWPSKGPICTSRPRASLCLQSSSLRMARVVLARPDSAQHPKMHRDV